MFVSNQQKEIIRIATRHKSPELTDRNLVVNFPKKLRLKTILLRMQTLKPSNYKFGIYLLHLISNHAKRSKDVTVMLSAQNLIQLLYEDYLFLQKYIYIIM